MIIAHQFLPEFATAIGSFPGVETRSIRDMPWTVPPGAEALLVDPFHPARLTRSSQKPEGWPGSLRWIHFRSTGIDALPAWVHEISLVTVSRGAQAVAIAEFVLAAMLAHEKRLPELWVGDRSEWNGACTGDLSGKILGIIGFGSIGREVAKRALAFDMQVVGSRRTNKSSEMAGVGIADLPTVLSSSDHLLVAAPLTDATRKMVSKAEFGIMKRGVHLMNVGRGGTLDTDALRVALGDGTVARASLDVVDPEPPPEGHWIYRHPKVRLTAHLSSRSPVTERRLDQMLKANIAAFAIDDFETMHGIVDPIEGY